MSAKVKTETPFASAPYCEFVIIVWISNIIIILHQFIEVYEFTLHKVEVQISEPYWWSVNLKQKQKPKLGYESNDE